MAKLKKKAGRPPAPANTTSWNFRISRDLLVRAREAAAADDRPLAKWFERAVRKALSEGGKP
jgi:predicted HicB family RNase H-like nuclease